MSKNVHSVDHEEIAEALESIRRRDCQNFGKLLENVHRVAEGIESTDKNYPRASDVFPGASKSETRELGTALTMLAELPSGVNVYGDQNPQRYDFSGTDKGSLTAVLRHVEGYWMEHGQ